MSTICRELHRNAQAGNYSHTHAQQIYEQRRKVAYTKERLKSQKLRNSVEEQIRIGLSPQQIAGVLKRSGADQHCSHEAIYQYIYKERPALIQYLRKKHKKRRKRGMKTRSNVVMREKTPFSERRNISAFHTVKRSEITHVQHVLNNRPRKCLDFQTSTQCCFVVHSNLNPPIIKCVRA